MSYIRCPAFYCLAFIFTFSVVTLTDGTETWMAYHATVDTGRTDRIARLERIDFNDDGSPRFPRPHGFGNPIEVPHGQA